MAGPPEPPNVADGSNLEVRSVTGTEAALKLKTLVPIERYDGTIDKMY